MKRRRDEETTIHHVALFVSVLTEQEVTTDTTQRLSLFEQIEIFADN